LRKKVHVTVDDDMDCSFMLIASDMGKNLDCTLAHIRVQTVSSSDSGGGAQWSPVKIINDHPCSWRCRSQDRDNDATVAVSVIVNWLMHVCGACLLSKDDVGEYILAYDMNAAAVGLVHISKDYQRASTTRGSRSPPSRLASSPDGKLSFVARRLLGKAHGDRRHMMVQRGPLLGLKLGMDHRLELRRSEERRGVLVVSW
jgi:hypothetical protein